MKNKNQTYRGLSTLEVLEGADNYNRWIADTVKQYAQSPILEVGAGIGNISDYFKNEKNMYITERDRELLKRLRNRFGKQRNITIKQLDVSKRNAMLEGKFATVFAVNVLEHIENDVKALSHMNLLLKKKGRLVMLVPAKKFAYTRLDKNLGHFRRYEKEEFRVKLESSGFVTEEIFYFNIVGLISWIIRDKLETQNVQLSSAQIAVFDKIVPVLRFIESRIPIPMGISLVVVAYKK